MNQQLYTCYKVKFLLYFMPTHENLLVIYLKSKYYHLDEQTPHLEILRIHNLG